MNISYNHESIYSVSKAEEINGAYWQNSFRIGFGSRGAYNLYLYSVYKQHQNEFINKWDMQLNVGVFRRGNETIWVARNQDYLWECFNLIRYHIGVFQKWTFFMSVKNHWWINVNNEIENKHSIISNSLFLTKTKGFGFYYRYVFSDRSVPDNEDRLGSLGFKVLF
ncbi:hypothetical protein H8D57_00760 [bacterium]|nr:hypothetical protein [bacterium]